MMGGQKNYDGGQRIVFSFPKKSSYKLPMRSSVSKFANLPAQVLTTVKSRFNIKSRFKVQNLVTKMEFHIKKSQFSVKSRLKESKCADGGLNRDFTVL